MYFFYVSRQFILLEDYEQLVNLIYNHDWLKYYVPTTDKTRLFIIAGENNKLFLNDLYSQKNIKEIKKP